MKRFAKILSLCMATVFAISTFTINSYAMSKVAEEHRRDLTAEEITTIQTIFVADHYGKLYPDVVKELGNDPGVLFNHFITFGIWEQRQPSAWFNVDAYASRNYDLQPIFGDDIIVYYMHYCTTKNEWKTRPTPTKEGALWDNANVYSVYDFVKGQQGPKKGAIPVMTPNSHPGVYVEQLQNDEKK
ncbi:hypothetical protein SAMN04487831_11258 [Pseudobutyrivibrio sp. UC1225]|uniref:hypothetical protein n=1 Tax=Pseudobutyrivibrio sp. UC1225 TaxID=1798185 RepID=UPI0008F3ABE6|nr:hypothetical protein [Pseudobutyrivibrio sp. UC1225]SFO21775.1 hypothetical protein SAMN04487831_11258 [Pseudobutyrivibrio sp. UC1225]